MNNLNNFVKLFKNLDPKYVQDQNDLQNEKDKKDYNDFKQKLQQGICKYCNQPINSFSENLTCFHYLLKPKGVKNKQIIEVLSNYEFLKIRAYLRWLGTCEGFLKNINDLNDEQSNDMIIHETIKYKNIEWALCCSENDFQGHTGRRSSFPHYHFQMVKNGLVCFKFATHHPKLTKYDIFELKIRKEHPEIYLDIPVVCPSIQNMFDTIPSDQLLKNMKKADNENDAQCRVQTFVKASKDQPISGEIIAKAFEESEERNIPIAQVLREKDLNAQVTTIINPSENIPRMSKRKKRKNR